MQANYYPFLRMNSREPNHWRSVQAWHKTCGHKLKDKTGGKRYLCKHCNEYVDKDGTDVTHNEKEAFTKRLISDNERIEKEWEAKC